MENRRLKIFFAIAAFTLNGCAVLHHVQVGQVDNRAAFNAVPFEIMVNEAGVNVNEIGDIAKATNSRAGDGASELADIIAVFQIGPRTGNPVYDDKYAEKIVFKIHDACPSGRVTGLMSIRENREYLVISGEIVKVTGFCLQSKEKPQTGRILKNKKEKSS